MVFTKLNEEQKEQIKKFEVTHGKTASPSLRAMLMRGTVFEDASRIVLESPPKEKKEKSPPKEKKQKVEPEPEELIVIGIKTEPVVKPKRSYNKKPKTWEQGLEQELRAKEAKEQEQEIVLEELAVKKPRNERVRKIKNDINIVV